MQRGRRESEQGRVGHGDAVERDDLRRALDQTGRLPAERRGDVGITHAAADEDLVAGAHVGDVGADAQNAAGGLVARNERVTKVRHSGEFPREEKPLGAARDGREARIDDDFVRLGFAQRDVAQLEPARFGKDDRARFHAAIFSLVWSCARVRMWLTMYWATLSP